MSLLEVMVSQIILLIVVTAVFSLLSAIIRSFHATDGGTEAQIHLREASHILLRDLQALGGADGRAGDLLDVTDSATGPDSFTVFKVNPGVCTNLAVKEIRPDENGLLIKKVAAARPTDPPVCPFGPTNPDCNSNLLLQGQTVALVGGAATMRVRVTALDSSDCTMQFDPGDTTNITALQRLQISFPPANFSTSTLGRALAFMGASSAVRPGISFAYRVNNENLERSVNGGAFEVVLDNIFDMQLARGYDLNDDGILDPNEFLGKSATLLKESDLPGANARTFFGVEVELVAFSRAPDGLTEAPPRLIENRTVGGLTPDKLSRRYRTAKMFMAARNRNQTNSNPTN